MSEGGKLILVGTGVRSLCQLTLEAIDEIERADVIYYAVRDATTEGFIKKRNKEAIDLYQYFINDEEIPEADIYIQIAEVMLAATRKGRRVVGAFFGHPGLFMSPNRRALAIAQAEGYTAKILPGVSVDDCLLADLGVDPSFIGCLTCEARDFMIHDHLGLTSRHVIMYEVGYLGFYGDDSKTDYFEYFVNRLEEIYGNEHSLVNYTAAISPLMQPVINTLTIGDLRKPEVRKQITSASTLYFPPKEILKLNKFGCDLLDQGITNKEQFQHAIFPGQPLYQLIGKALPHEAYSEHAQQVIAGLHRRKISPRYPLYRASAAMQSTMEDIYLKNEVRKEYLISPTSFTLRVVPGLKEMEKIALASGNYSQIDGAMKSGDLDQAITK
ncbi:hypothetical protein AOL_s00076g406 [Orbilia oligospora ATCC 24927]|uniref:Tetrapyrrole methylase domain-containing protein n=1 Tax=Arthrobotrys oligospora (strain ATCC 24927 / CBS 115.81 / DSM 1491) TaxID=756982 RepID=G1X9R7_ARTOA|nr:hypothetical protein AOL_s00076g406 [Orbilia oligospora ATCC 24927]EGX50055.1 hypothetical protein AOL_s00076g406 [Orbilia oligospora ATCC 24927]